MNKTPSPRVLEHYGVKGMRWGVRKDRRTSGRRRTRGGRSSLPTSKDHRRSVAIRKKRVSQMSNDELKIVLNRLRLEKEFKQLSATTMQRGRREVGKALGKAGTNTLTMYARMAIVVVVGKFLKDGVSALAKKIYPYANI
jgi:hypothetical protein